MEEMSNEQPHGKKLGDSIFQFYQPKEKESVELEVVFVHGLEIGNRGDAYWKTWLARDGTPDNVWPMAWLPTDSPCARVFALKYDASMIKSDTHGRMDLPLVGEKLAQEMVDFGRIGQNGVPVVFVCHGFGGLVAKQIVVSAKQRLPDNIGIQNLLQNIGAFLFYSTPHHGSSVASSSSYWCNVKEGGKSPLWENSKVLNTEISRLSQDFEQAKHRTWYFGSAAEMHVTSPYGEMVVAEASSRYAGGDYLALSENHPDVVKPRTKEDSSYQWLIKCLAEVLRRDAIHRSPRVETNVLESLVRSREQEEAVKVMLQKVPIVGMIGMGGIGKTTLAKVVYQSICRDFEKSSYLEGVKSNASRDENSNASLDKVLILLLRHFGITDRTTGRNAQLIDLKDSKSTLIEDLKTCVQQHRVLVVLDDVGTSENLDRLLEDMDFLNGNKESRLIITCRSWQALKHVRGCTKYEVEPMRSGEDMELFSYHAFEGARTMEQRREVLRDLLSKDTSQHLIDDFGTVCDDVVKACGGLPLSLKVMGGCLGGYLKDRKNANISGIECLKYWKGTFEKLKNGELLQGGHDNDKLWKVLQICYDVLGPKEQNMFLDIACFFCDSVRYGEQTLLQIWGGDSSKSVELRNLEERCLVKIEKEGGTVTMHDQLRDMGRRVGQGEMTRLWDCKHVNQILQNNEIKSESIQGLSLEQWRLESVPVPVIKRKGLTLDCPNLRLLNLQMVDKNTAEAIIIKESTSVHWLCMKGFHTKVPKFVWICTGLRVLDLSHCTALKILHGSIGKLANLRKLDLAGCWRLTSLPNSIGNLGNLSELHLGSCAGLTSLPRSIGNLGKLSKLDISGCLRLNSLPDSIRNLGNLSELDLSSYTGPKGIPNFFDLIIEISLQHWRKLQIIRLSTFGLFTSLPDSIGNLGNLSKLDLYGCPKLTSLPDFIGNLGNLSELDLRSCRALTSLPDSIGNLGNLSELDLRSCRALTSLPDSIGNLGNLSKLDLSDCTGLTSLPGSIGNMGNLSELILCRCKKLTSLPDSIGNLGKLWKLNLSDCELLISLPDSIGNLGNLSELDLRSCRALTSLPDSIGNLGNLSKLDLSDCTGLTSLPGSIGNMGNLLELILCRCKKLTSLPDSIGNLGKLWKLNLSDCELLISLPDSIGNLGNLSELDLRSCSAKSLIFVVAARTSDLLRLATSATYESLIFVIA